MNLISLILVAVVLDYFKWPSVIGLKVGDMSSQSVIILARVPCEPDISQILLESRPHVINIATFTGTPVP